MKDKFNEEVGQRIRKSRNNLDMTMKELGSRVGLSEATIQRYESGKIKGVDINLINDFAKILKVTPAYLMGWEENITEPELDDDMVVLARGAKTLTKEQKKLIKNMIDEFNKNNED